MGISSSKTEKCEALRLCKERKKFLKKAIDSRYDFAAAHLTYIQSLKNIGISLYKFAESEVVLLDNLDPSANLTQNEQTPNLSPLTPQAGGGSGVSSLSYMRSSVSNAVTVSLNPSNIDISTNNRVYVNDVDFTMPPPPPPPFESGSTWDYFGPNDENESFRFVGHDGFHVNFDNMSVRKDFDVKDSGVDGGVVGRDESAKTDGNGSDGVASKTVELDNGSDSVGGGVLVCRNSQAESNKDSCLTEGEREDPSEFITHRAKDFLSSIKDIESRFFRASECGKEVSRMLEADKIWVGYSEAKGSSTASSLLCVNCCRGKTALVSHEPQHVTKVITWKRSTSSHSSSSRNPLASTSKDDNDDSGSDFIEEFCMIAGSHSSTLDRLYAWERKLYDEVKASESIRKEYDRKCDTLRHQFAKDQKTHVIDKTRALVKDLHSRIIVALHTVDSISKRIEKMRDEELQPQLLELIQGLNRMWKAMLECHHAQYITISLAYHIKKQKNGTRQEERNKQIMDELQNEIECFGLSFADMVNSQTSYVESINSWLQNCIIQPKERLRKRPWSPRRSVGPPIFVICRDWSAGIQSLPSQELNDAIKAFLAHLHQHSAQDVDQKETSLTGEEDKGEEERKNDDETPLNLRSMHSSLTKVLDGLTKFSEASLKMYEDIKQKSEAAQSMYSNYRPPPRAFSI
uniref:nitrate regulatory gene2 protein n=1 Tax=Erigeron canadensis TaxID=72917 RepID=UPI001CB92401|nr:nitrate regulatory gene2 protein [Erigeron canadensis]